MPQLQLMWLWERSLLWEKGCCGQVVGTEDRDTFKKECIRKMGDKIELS